MYKFFVVIILGLQVHTALAISNIESERINLPEQGLSGSLKLGLDGKSGDEEKQSYSGAAKIVYRSDDDIFMSLIGMEYGTDQHIKNTDNSFLHGRWTHLLNDRWATEIFSQWEENEFSNLTSRTLGGGGARYTLAQEEDSYLLAIGVGAFREYEKVNLITYEDINRLWRMNTYYSYNYQINQQLAFANTTYFQPDVANSDDYRILFDAGFSVTLTTRLQFKINYRLSYDSQPAKNLAIHPPIDNHKTNTEYKTALAWNF